jgi:hypothetical protein
MSNNPMPRDRLKNGNPAGDPNAARRCGARTRTQLPCRQPAMANGRCRMHGGKSPGAPKGEHNGNYRHGRRTGDAMADKREAAAALRQLRAVMRCCLEE